MATNLPIQKAMVERNVTMDGFDVHIMTWRDHASVAIMQELGAPVIRTYHGDGSYAERTPAFTLPKTSAQALMDAMWEAGIRPSDQTDKGEYGVVAAMREHLDDLRAIAFRSVGIPLSKDEPMTVNTSDSF